MFRDSIPPWIDYYSLPCNISPYSLKITLLDSNIHTCRSYSSNRTRDLRLDRNANDILPYFPPPQLLLTMVDQNFGIIILALLFIQVGFGYYHHHRFVKDRPSSRRWFTHTHLWLGRLTILGGLVNCGFGLVLAFVDWKYVILWWIICGVLAIGYAVASVVTFKYRAKKAGEPFGNTNGKMFSPERYKRAESYEMMGSNTNSPRRI